MDAKLIDESARLRALDRLQVLDTPPEPAFERLTSLVCSVLEVPISAVSLVETDRQWFKSVRGLPVGETPRDISFCTHTIMQREPMIVTDATLDSRFAANPFVTGPAGIRCYAGVPLASSDGYNLGSLCAMDTRPRDFSDAQIALLSDFGALVVAELELRTLVQSDHLTGAMSRRAFIDGVAREIDRSKRYGHPVSLLVFDVDHFKKINDRFGHLAGDHVLKTVATACAATLRPTDVFGRVGGEEFAVCLPETDLPAALACAERLRAAIGQAGPLDAELPRVTASFGVATLAEAETYGAWFARADAAMYAAKHNGRDQCRVCDQDPTRKLAA